MNGILATLRGLGPARLGLMGAVAAGLLASVAFVLAVAGILLLL